MAALEQLLSQLDQSAQHLDQVFAALERQADLLRVRNLALQVDFSQNLRQLAVDLPSVSNTVNEQDKERRQLQALLETAALINSSFDLDEILGRSLDAVLSLTDAERGYIVLTSESDAYEVRIARTQIRDDEEDEGISHTILREVLQSQQPLLTDNAAHDPRMASSATVNRFVLRSVLCVPLIFKGSLEGAVYVDNRFKSGVFTEQSLALLTAFANQMVVAIANARLFSDLQTTLREIAQATALMEDIFASIASGVITTDADELIMTCNAAAAAMLSLQPEAVLGRRLLDVLPPVGLTFTDALDAVRSQHLSRSFALETEIDDRRRVDLDVKISPLQNDESDTSGIALVLEDLTEQRLHDETLELVRRYLPPGMIESIHEIAALGIGGERREVSCVFVDTGVVNSVQSQSVGTAFEALNRFLEAATQAVHHSGGLIDKYLGSELMALFNTQLNPQSDHAMQALSAARRVSEQFRSFYTDYAVAPEQQRLRIGIHTGIATLGNVGGVQRRSFTALGDSINLAKRLQENAMPGQILVSEATVSRLDKQMPDWLHLMERRAIHVKGRQQQVSVFEVRL